MEPIKQLQKHNTMVSVVLLSVCYCPLNPIKCSEWAAMRLVCVCALGCSRASTALRLAEEQSIHAGSMLHAKLVGLAKRASHPFVGFEREELDGGVGEDADHLGSVAFVEPQELLLLHYAFEPRKDSWGKRGQYVSLKTAWWGNPHRDKYG